MNSRRCIDADGNKLEDATCEASGAGPAPSREATCRAPCPADCVVSTWSEWSPCEQVSVFYPFLKKTTADYAFCQIVGQLLSNRWFQFDLQNQKSRWINQRNGPPQGSVLVPTLFNIYTNDQPMAQYIRSFIYADEIKYSDNVAIRHIEHPCYRSIGMIEFNGLIQSAVRPYTTYTINSNCLMGTNVQRK